MMQTIFKIYPQVIKDRFFILALLLITSLLYSFYFTAPLTSVIGDAQRYHGYYMYIIRYSLTHFGQFGLWDQLLSSGMSWISNPGGLLFFPTTWIIISLFEDFLFGAKMLFFIHALTAAVSMYFLLRVLSLARITSFFIALASVSNQYIMLFAQNGWFEEFFGFTIIPLSVGLLWLTLTKKRYLYAVLGAVVMSFHFWGSTFYVFHYNAIILLFISMLFMIHIIWKHRREKVTFLLKQVRSYVFLNSVFWVGFISISAIKLLPILEFRNISSRNFLLLSDIEHPSNVMTPEFLYSRLRAFFIDPSHVNWFTNWGNDIGAILIIIFLVYFLFKRSFVPGAFLGLLVIGIWGYLANRIPLDLYAFFYHFLPGFNAIKYPYRFIIVVHFAFLICIALGLDVLIQQKSKRFARYVGYVLGIILIASTTLYTITANSTHQFPQKTDIRSELKKLEMVHIEKGETLYDAPRISEVSSVHLVALLAKIMNIYKNEGRIRSTFYETLHDQNISHERLLLSGVASTQHFYDEIVPTYQFGIFPSGTIQDSLEYTKNRYKIFSILNTRFQLQSADNFEFAGCWELMLTGMTHATPSGEMLPKEGVCDFFQSRFVRIHGQKNGGIYYDKAVLSRAAIIPNSILLITDNRFHDFSGFIAKKIMFHPDFDEHKISILSGASSFLDDYDLETLRGFKALFIVNAKIRDTKKVEDIINQYKYFGGNVVLLHSTWNPYESLHQRSSSIWTNKPAWSYSKADSEKLSVLFKKLRSESFVGNIEVNKFTPEDLLFTVATDRNDVVLQYSDSFYPGWKAMLDGKKIPVYMADGLVKGVIIPTKGTHTVRFYYNPDSLKKGAIITLVAVAILLSAAGILMWRKRKKIKQVFKQVITFPRTIFNIFSNIKNMYKQKKLLTIIYIAIIPLVVMAFLLYIYRSIFLNTITSAGDLPYYWDTYIKELGIPYLWNPHWPTGLGGNQSIILPLKFYIQLPIELLVNQWHIPWEFVERVFLFWTFFFLSIYSSYKLCRSWIGSLVYTSNTWILMVFSGGQMGVALSYAIAPLVLTQFIDLLNLFNLSIINKLKIKNLKILRYSVVAGILLAIQVMFDLRIAYILVMGIALYLIMNIKYALSKENIRNALYIILYTIIVPLGITIFLHAFWLIPFVLSDHSSMTSISSLQTTVEQVKFFSFATFSNTVGLLHPNWPENIFGKVGFMKEEFLLLPILAFSSLLFIKISNLQRESQNLLRYSSIRQLTKGSSTFSVLGLQPRTIIYFCLLGLLGAFLAKGANEPFGVINLWMFDTIPGMQMFRDPTKFYLLVALSYSILIPFSIYHIYNWLILNSKFKILNIHFKFKIYNAFLLFTILYLLFLIHPLLSVSVLNPRNVPKEYIQLKDFLVSQPQFFRTLWIPKYQRFGYFAGQHPAFSGSDIFTITHGKDMVKLLRKPEALSLLQNLSVRYVILPYDSEGEIFLQDRKYDDEVYIELLSDLRRIPWLPQRTQFGKIIVFEVPNPKDHFWIQRQDNSEAYIENYTKIDDTKYILSLKDVTEGDVLIFSEQYDPGWIVDNRIHKTWSTPYKKRLNSYMLWEAGNYSAEVNFQSQKLLVIGWVISVAAAILLCTLLFGIYFWNKKYRSNSLV